MAAIDKQATNTSRVGEKWGPVFVPADMPSGPRQQQYVKAITILTYDIDNKDGDNKAIPDPLSLAEMVEVIRCAALNSILYETHSSRPNHPRFRLLGAAGRAHSNPCV